MRLGVLVAELRLLLLLLLLLLSWLLLCLRLKGGAAAASLRLAGGVAGSAHTWWTFSLEGVALEPRWLEWRKGSGGAESVMSTEALRDVRGVVEREAAAAAAAC